MNSSNRWLRTKVLSLLTLLPMPSVVLAAESALTADANRLERNRALKEMNAATLGTDGSWHLLNPALRAMREEVLAPLTLTTTREKAIERLRARHPSLSGAEAEITFEEVVRVLMEKGLITVNETELVSHGDSHIFPQK
ncbi:MAG TPA: hypothetical protein VL588_12860 [Bdellovibrionota bacterium]|nr:hypothetical protein [Bdellovibrionota bacterium]